MVIKLIDLGTQPRGVGGDTNYKAFTKVNENFSQIREALGAGEGVEIPDALPVEKGGTGAITAKQAVINLGLEPVNSLDSSDNYRPLTAIQGKKLQDGKLGKNENAASAAKLSTIRSLTWTGDATGTMNFDGSGDASTSLTLKDSGVNAGSYGSSTSVPVLAIDSKGRVTSASATAIPTATTGNSGLVQLSSAVDSVLDNKAATPSAVKAAYDLAKSAIPKAEKGVANGVATLDGSGLVPASQLPSFVDDILEFSSLNELPQVGEAGKIYVTIDANMTFRWTGTDYVAVGSGSGVASSAIKLYAPCKINDVDFDGAQDINIEAPLRYMGNITNQEQLDAAVDDGKYTVSGLIIAGLYSYGFLVVLRNGGVCHQTYYPHLGSDIDALSPNNGTMAMRQAWNDAWSGWRVVGTRDDSKLPLAGGTLSGKLTTKPSVLALTLDELGGGDGAPIQTPRIHVPYDVNGYIPFIHGSMQTEYHGYATQISIGGYRGGNTWENAGAYIAVGENDWAPTEAFMFLNGRKISNTAGPIDLVGNASSATKLAIPRNLFGQTFDGSGDVGGTITASTGLIQASAFHFIDMGRIGLDRMNFHNYGAIFNFINTINGEVVARISGSGIDCNAASASKVINIGNSAAYEGVGANPPYGLTLASVYDNGYPTPYGNVLRLGGSGQGEILVGWPDEGGGLAPSFIRGKRDGGLGDWTPWREIVFVDSLPWHNVGSATRLNTPRKINGVEFDGTKDINVVDDPLMYMPIPYPKDTPPNGYLVMMGQAISESFYPKLFALYGSHLPDMRAYSVRGLDYGRGIDVDRAVLSEQLDAIKEHKHPSIRQGGANVPSSGGWSYRDALAGGETGATGGTETRVKNIAYLYIVREG